MAGPLPAQLALSGVFMNHMELVRSCVLWAAAFLLFCLNTGKSFGERTGKKGVPMSGPMGPPFFAWMKG